MKQTDARGAAGTDRRDVERRAGGVVHLRSPHPLAPYPRHLLERLRYWAERAPERTLFAQRAGSGWRTLTYGDALVGARRVGQALLERGLSAERPLVVLSGQRHRACAAAPAARCTPVSPMRRFRPRIPCCRPTSASCARCWISSRRDSSTPPTARRTARPIAALGIEAIHEVPEARAAPTRWTRRTQRVGPDTIAKFLFTSGSTGKPKAVINTQRMWCANQVMARTALAFVQDEPPVLVEWAPWHHTAGGNKDLGLCLFNGGSLYIDEGKPLPGAIEATVRNLREIAPTWYFNVPKGYEALLPYLRADAALRRNFFSRLKMLWFAGAGVSQPCSTSARSSPIDTCGEEVLVRHRPRLHRNRALYAGPHLGHGRRHQHGPAAAGRGAEAGAACEGKYEARIKGPHITPGYWREPELTRQAFDEEGYYRLGDTFALDDPATRQGPALPRTASRRTSSSPPAPGCTSGRCARG